jgi:tetratricopeptide (TPR) repeat protein
MTIPVEATISELLAGKRVAFVGKLGSLTKRQAKQLVRDQGGLSCDRIEPGVELIVVGADELPFAEHEELLTPEVRRWAAEGKTEIITETQFWQHLGIIDHEQQVRRLYTPAMLAQLLNVPVETIRRWHRRGLIVPEHEIHRLPYFDFQEVATARRLAELVAAGASPKSIEEKLKQLSAIVPDAARPLAQLSVIVEGKELLLRRGDSLVEPRGQRRFDFDASENESDATSEPSTLRMDRPPGIRPINEANSYDDFIRLAAQFEEEGELDAAIEAYRSACMGYGASAEVCFQLADLLYRQGEISAARERYYMAIELDEDFVEARANLGCILAETGDHELAVSAFEGALRFYPDYPDARFHLARTFDRLGKTADAEIHWRKFLETAPNSPWAEEARLRLGEASDDATQG